MTTTRRTLIERGLACANELNARLGVPVEVTLSVPRHVFDDVIIDPESMVKPTDTATSEPIRLADRVLMVRAPR